MPRLPSHGALGAVLLLTTVVADRVDKWQRSRSARRPPARPPTPGSSASASAASTPLLRTRAVTPTLVSHSAAATLLALVLLRLSLALGFKLVSRVTRRSGGGAGRGLHPLVRSLTTAAAIAYGAYYALVVARRPRLEWDTSSAFLRSVVSRCSLLTEPFCPTPWASDGNIQLALYIALSAFDKPPAYKRAEITLPDGELVTVDWHLAPKPRAPPGYDHVPTVVSLHGITGDSEALAAWVRATEAKGWHSAIVNRRGHSGQELKTPTMNVMGDTHDLRFAVSHIQQECERMRPGAPLFLVGISAGSGLLVRYLGEEGVESPMMAAASLCPGYNIAQCFGRLVPMYDKILLKRSKDFFIARNSVFDREDPRFAAIMAAETMNDFLFRSSHLTTTDERVHVESNYHREVVSKMTPKERIDHAIEEYGDSLPDDLDSEQRAAAADFLFRSNPMPVAERITTPLLVLNALDDPVCVESNIPKGRDLDKFKKETAMLAFTERGSHCAFYDGLVTPQSWMDRLTLQWFEAVAVHRHEERAKHDAGARGAGVGAAGSAAAATGASREART